VRGVQKHELKKMQKVHVKTFFRENSQKIDKNFDVSFSSTFFVLKFDIDLLSSIFVCVLLCVLFVCLLPPFARDSPVPRGGGGSWELLGTGYGPEVPGFIFFPDGTWH
jgi:hypothetical protein